MPEFLLAGYESACEKEANYEDRTKAAPLVSCAVCDEGVEPSACACADERSQGCSAKHICALREHRTCHERMTRKEPRVSAADEIASKKLDGEKSNGKRRERDSATHEDRSVEPANEECKHRPPRTLIERERWVSECGHIAQPPFKCEKHRQMRDNDKQRARSFGWGFARSGVEQRGPHEGEKPKSSGLEGKIERECGEAGEQRTHAQ